MNCTFNTKYFNESDAKCVLKTEDGRNKFASGHAELIKAIDDVVVSKTLFVKSQVECH